MIALALMLAAAPQARAWDHHDALTALALRDIPVLDSSVVPETLDAYLTASLRAGGKAVFLRAIKVNPTTDFPSRAGEAFGAPVAARAVISAYADEPDWGLDQSLFDYYPELWKDDYQFMGGRTGPQTRAFRHMYWPGGFYRQPSPPARIPVHDPTPLGEAPQRCSLFFSLAREAFASGHPYWGARFLAWSLHYLEDLGQPFHATQLATTMFVRPTPDGRSIDVEKTTRVVAYFHLAVDGFPQHSGEGPNGGPLRARETADLVGTAAIPFSSALSLAQDAAVVSAGQAQVLGEAAADFFPDPDAGALADPAGRVYTDQFWTSLQAAVAADPRGSEAFLTPLDARLADTAVRARTLVLEALKSVPAAPAPQAPGLAARPVPLLAPPLFR